MNWDAISAVAELGGELAVRKLQARNSERNGRMADWQRHLVRIIDGQLTPKDGVFR